MNILRVVTPLIFLLVPLVAVHGQVTDEYPEVNSGFHVVPDACRGDTAATDCGYDEVIILIRNIIALLLYLAIFVGTLLFVYAGFLYLTNSGNPSRISRAKSVMWSTVIGMIVAFSAYLIVEVIVTTLGVCTDFNPFTGIDTSC